MVSINEFVIARDAKYLYLKASIDDMEYFENVFIDYLEFTLHKVVNGTIETSTIELNPDGTLHTEPLEIEVKNVDLTLTPQDLGLSDFQTPVIEVKVYTKGYPSADTPCGMDEEYVVGITYNKSVLYDKGLSFIHQVGQDCNIPDDFINWILSSSAFDLALKSGNMNDALSWWLRLTSNRSNGYSRNSNCGCHG
jgi:hypothetical protein